MRTANQGKQNPETALSSDEIKRELEQFPVEALEMALMILRMRQPATNQ